MKSKEIVIDNFGSGNVIAVLQKGEILDIFFDPPSNSSFYPVNTFLEAKISRRVSKRGGYFVKLPNGKEGFLRSKTFYKEGTSVNVQSKVFYDPEKPQIFTDKLKVISRFFILNFCGKGISFSRKFPKSFDKKKIYQLVNRNVQKYKNLNLVCRSSVAHSNLSDVELSLDSLWKHSKRILKALLNDKIYFDGYARKQAFERYSANECRIIEEDNVFDKLGIWCKLDKLSEKKVVFGQGSFLLVEQTNSFCTFDVNSGSYLGGTIHSINMAASKEIYSLIKLLGVGGKIIIDFLPCSETLKDDILNEMLKYSALDFAKTKIWGWTKGGSFELERERDRMPLNMLLDNN